MPSDFAFRLSTYLTLATACACLAFSEWDLLPEVTVVAGLAVVLLVVTFRIGPRFELSLTAANRVGLGIAVVAGAWIAYQFVNKNSLIYTLPWPVSLLPYIGPLMMVLMVAKMFRPKHVGDWWALQGMALATAGLAAAMAESAAFGVLLTLYAVAAVWSVTAFYFRRTAGAVPPVPDTDPGPAPEIVTPPAATAWAEVRGPVGWVLAAVAVAVPLFLLTPRSGAPRWSYTTGGMTTGLSGDQTVDLTREGTVEGSAEVAYEVRAADRAGRPLDDLGPAQRWRAIGFNQYNRGRWTRTDAGLPLASRSRVPIPRGNEGDGPPPPEPVVPPDLGPGQVTLEFTRVAPSGDPILYDPVAWRAGEPPPAWSVLPDGRRAWWQLSDASFRPNGLGLRRTQTYGQVAAPPAEPDLGPPMEFLPDPANPELNPADPRSPLQQARLPKLRDHAERVVRDLAAAGALPAGVLDRADARVTLRVHPQDYEAVARALCDHLRAPGAFAYSLTLERADRSSDPVEDFVLRTRAGHCQRFASALALMLRGVGVPSVYVLGYKGCEPQGDGLYLIRQESAHAWVEVLVQRPRAAADGTRPPVVWHWLSLDPTPDTGGEAAETEQGWPEAIRTTAVGFFEDFILGYNPQQQTRMRTAARAWADRNAVPLVGLPVAAGLLAFAWVRARRLRTRAAAGGGPRRSGVPWYDRLTRALDAAGFRPEPGATPQEYAVAAAAVLRDRPESAAVAAVPTAVTAAFYRARYGGLPPTADELADLDSAVGQFEAALRSFPRPGPPGIA